jgi:hypothetical protein
VFYDRNGRRFWRRLRGFRPIRLNDALIRKFDIRVEGGRPRHELGHPPPAVTATQRFGQDLFVAMGAGARGARRVTRGCVHDNLTLHPTECNYSPKLSKSAEFGSSGAKIAEILS